MGKAFVAMTNGDIYYISPTDLSRIVDKLCAGGNNVATFKDIKSGAQIVVNTKQVSSIVEEDI